MSTSSSSTSTPLSDPSMLPQPPPLDQTTQQQQSLHSPSHPGHGSVGPVIGVLMVVALLGVLAVFVGRLCSGRGIRSRLKYDFDGWVEKKCSSCIDGRIEPTPPPQPRVVVEQRVSLAPPPEAEEGGGGTGDGGSFHQNGSS